MAWVRGAAVLALATLLVGCGDDDEFTSPVPADAPESTPSIAADTAGEQSDAPSSDDSADESGGDDVDADLLRPGVDDVCQDDIQALPLDEAVMAETPDGEDPFHRMYFCIQVPDGVPAMTVALSDADADADIDLFVGHPDLETVQGGGLAFWASDTFGSGDEQVLIEPGFSKDELGRLVEAEQINRGPYYVEISGDLTTFTITASTSR